ncbi:MAG: DUF4145 domain-containing protein [candidate division KSB1 bacterium]|nr:DUF4145 domain-containing protein [candidate division KSB1 bacterium]
MNDYLPLPERILKLIQLIRDTYDFENNCMNMDENQSDEFESLWGSIVEDLMWAPGTLIYIEDENERKVTQSIINWIWDTTDSEEIFDEITGGGYSGLLVNIIGDYIDRAKKLRPTIISINPANIEFKSYFEEAMKAWLYGLNNSSLILCCSIIEDLLKTQLYNIDLNLALDLEYEGEKLKGIKNKKLERLIDEAYNHEIIDKREKESAHGIRILRNNALHNLEKIGEEQTLKAILGTKELVEKILSRTGLS